MSKASLVPEFSPAVHSPDLLAERTSGKSPESSKTGNFGRKMGGSVGSKGARNPGGFRLVGQWLPEGEKAEHKPKLQSILAKSNRETRP